MELDEKKALVSGARSVALNPIAERMAWYNELGKEEREYISGVISHELEVWFGLLPFTVVGNAEEE